ncbi:hypothetical protein GCM10009785_12310 [Brooklawnia cerclae]
MLAVPAESPEAASAPGDRPVREPESYEPVRDEPEPDGVVPNELEP